MIASVQGGAREATSDRFFTATANDNVAMSMAAFRAFAPADAGDRIARFLDGRNFERPTLILDLDRVAADYQALALGLGGAHIHYAVKANPAPQVLSRLIGLGCRFDAASRGEIETVLGLGADPAHVSFGNTVKKATDIAWAHARGIDLYSADAEEELAKLAAHAPGARVYIRLLVEASEADWPLSRKFGCAPEEAIRLMAIAAGYGLRPVGLSFHVGSQTRQARMWRPILDQVAQVWHAARASGFDLDLLNIGGGFPAFYGEEVQGATAYGAEIMAEIRARFGDTPRYIMAEPGRGLVAQAGVIQAEVLLVSRKRSSDIARWVYLDIGKFSGLAETMDEAIRYQFVTTADGGDTGPCVLAGPSCDSADVLYEKRPVQLPLALSAGDKIRILCCGAYTTSYSSVGFNGFPPLDIICI